MKIAELRDAENYNANNSPKRCFFCGSEDMEENITDSMEHIVLEYEVRCCSCGTRIGYWAHGYFDPSFALQGQ